MAAQRELQIELSRATSLQSIIRNLNPFRKDRGSDAGWRGRATYRLRVGLTAAETQTVVRRDLDLALPKDSLVGFRRWASRTPYDPLIGTALYRAALSGEEVARALGTLEGGPPGAVRRLLLLAGSDAVSALANVPWELAATRPDRDTPIGLDPQLEVIRALRVAARPGENVAEERLRVGFILANTPPTFSSQARELADRMQQLSDEYRAVLDMRRVGTPDTVPSLAMAADEIWGWQPHVLVFVGHGRVTPKGTFLSFSEPHPAGTVVARLVDPARPPYVVLLASCHTARLPDSAAAGDAEVTTNAAQLGTLAFLEAGVTAVIAMQGSVRAGYVVDFLDSFFSAGFRMESLSGAVRYARQHHILGAGPPESVEWALPALVVNASRVDALPAFSAWGEAFRVRLGQLERAIPAVPTYLLRGEVDAWLADTLETRAGVAALVAPSGSGGTTTVRRAARTHLAAGAAGLGVAESAAHRAVVYFDVRALPVPALGSFVDAFLEEGSRPLTLFGAGGAAAPGSPAVRHLHDVLGLLDQDGSVLVLDHADLLSPADFAELLAGAHDRLQRALLLVLVREDSMLPADTVRVEIAPLDEEQTRAFADLHGQPAEVGTRWFEQSGGDLGLLTLLRIGREGDMLTTEAALDAAVATSREVQRAHRGLSAVMRLCACFPGGVRVSWIPSLVDANPADVAEDVAEAVRRQLVFRTTRDGVDWIVAPELLASGFRALMQEDGDTGEAGSGGVGALPGLAEIASKTLVYLDLILPLGDLLQRPTVLREYPGVGGLYRRCVSLLFEAGERGTAAELARGLSRVNRELGRHHANRDLFEELLAQVPMQSWQPGDLLELAIAAHALGETPLHAELLSYIERSGAPVTSIQRVTLLLQRASLLKDQGRVDLLGQIRALYAKAEAIAGDALAAGTAEDEEVLTEQLGHVLHNRGVLERYFAHDAPAAVDFLEQAESRYRKAGRTRLAVASAVERIGAAVHALDPVELPGDPEAALQGHIKELNALGAEDDVAFALYQLGRVRKHRRPSNGAGAAEAFLQAARVAENAGLQRMQAAALRQHAEWALRAGDIDRARAVEELRESVRLAGAFEGDAWAGRIRRDALTVLTGLLVEDNAPEASQVGAEAVQAGLRAPLNPGQPGTDRRRLARAFVAAWLAGCRDPSLLDSVCTSMSLQVHGEDALGHLRALAEDRAEA